jgi:hypothetical protein
MTKKIALIGGGTFSHVRNHLSISAPAFGATVNTLEVMFKERLNQNKVFNDRLSVLDNVSDSAFARAAQQLKAEHGRPYYDVVKYLTKMADPLSTIVTNKDVSDLVDRLIADPEVRVIVFNPALVDFDGSIGGVPSGKHADRLRTDKGNQIMELTPADKIIGRIRKERKDVFVIGFKTTSDSIPDEQYQRGLELLKKNSLNLVVANDTVTRNNMIIAPEETRYMETGNRIELLTFLTDMVLSRVENKFTRSTVVDGDPVDWNGPDVSDALRTIVNHCIKQGAYKPFLGKTAGHFASKVNETQILTSIRKSNYNELDKVGLVRVDSKNADEVIAHGFKPSVGGQSQRIIFREHPEMDSIVHFHCAPKPEIEQRAWFNDTGRVDDDVVVDHTIVSVRSQWQNECGSHQCGQNTSSGLVKVDLGDGDIIKVVYLDQHGPNIVFNHNINPQKVIDYIDRTFDLHGKTGGLV